MTTPVTLLAIGIFWGAVLAWSIAVARAAGKPTPKPRIAGWDRRVTDVWACPECGLRVGFGGCRTSPPKCSGSHAPVEMEQVIA